MSNQEATLTAAGIRYLLAINELDRSESGVKGSEIAKYLGVTKPSVHTMMKKLCEKGYSPADVLSGQPQFLPSHSAELYYV